MKRFLRSLWREEKGFTLIELGPILALLAALVAARDWEQIYAILRELLQLLGG